MEPKNTVKAGERGREKRLPYGTAPLALDLSQAIALTARIGQEGRPVPAARLAVLMGNTVSSSAFPKKVRALSSYGLLGYEAGDQCALTELGLMIASPRSPQAAAEARKQAFLNVSQYDSVFQQHKGKLLPADEFLRNIFEQDEKIPREYSQHWVNGFKEGARTAGLLHDRGDGRIQISDTPLAGDPVPPRAVLPPEVPIERDDAREDYPANGLSAPAARNVGPPNPAMMGASGHCTRIELSDGRRAEFSIPDKLTLRDAQRLKKALDGVAVIIDSMVSEEDAGPPPRGSKS